MPDDFVIARNPEAESTLPYLLRIPLGDGVLLKAREVWPRTSKVYCHRFFDGRPADAAIADGLAEAQTALPTVPIVFTDNRKLAQEWVYRFLAAAVVAAEVDGFGAEAVADFTAAAPPPPREPTPAELRAWALANGFDVSPKGRVPANVRKAWEQRGVGDVTQPGGAAGAP